MVFLQKKPLIYPLMHFDLTEEGIFLCRKINLMQITKYYKVLVYSLSI